MSEFERESMLLEVAKYHRGGMEERRRTLLRAFVGMIVMNLVITRGVLEVLPGSTAFAGTAMRITVTCVLVLTFLAYVMFSVQIERNSVLSNKNYIACEAKLHERLELPEITMRPHTLRDAWASTWTSMVALLLSAGCVLAVWVLCPKEIP